MNSMNTWQQCGLFSLALLCSCGGGGGSQGDEPMCNQEEIGAFDAPCMTEACCDSDNCFYVMDDGATYECNNPGDCTDAANRVLDHCTGCDADWDVETVPCAPCEGNYYLGSGGGTCGVEMFSRCSTITGSLDISFTGPFDRVFCLTDVQGDMEVAYNDDMPDLNMLSGLVTVDGDLLIRSNDTLVGLEGLSNLTTVGGDLEVAYNDLLASVDGLSSLTTIGGALEILGNGQVCEAEAEAWAATLDIGSGSTIFGNKGACD